MNAPTFLARTERHKPDNARCRRSVATLPPEAPWSNECAPTFTLDREIARARAEMGEAEWMRRNSEWDS